MTRIRQQLNYLVLAVVFLITLTGLLFKITIGQLLVTWAVFLAAIALLLGILNLFSLHLQRSLKGNGYSLVLILSMLLVWLMPLADQLGWIENGADLLFQWVQIPLEMALASLLAFFLLFAGIRLFQQPQGRPWSALFLGTAIIVLLGSIPLPAPISGVWTTARNFINHLVVNAGIRGILIGIALGTITMTIRLLAGLERPYHK